MVGGLLTYRQLRSVYFGGLTDLVSVHMYKLGAVYRTGIVWKSRQLGLRNIKNIYDKSAIC